METIQHKLSRKVDKAIEKDPKLKAKAQQLIDGIDIETRFTILDANALRFAEGVSTKQASQFVFRIVKNWNQATLGEKYVALETFKAIEEASKGE